jgi:hypothetical protein
MKLLSLAAALALGAADFEAPVTYRASALLQAKLLQGPHHRLAEEVRAEGYYLEFQILSDFGDLPAEGRTVLHTRLSEVDALARLSEVSKTEVFARAAGGALLDIGKGVVSAARDPEGTVKGIGGGLKRFGVNLGRKAKRAADSVTKDDKTPEGPERSGGEKAADAAGSAARSVLGINSAARKWAEKLGVDPYTTNPVLHEALVDVGKIDAAGSIVARIVVPIPMIVSTTATVGDLVWKADPEELRKRNERQVAALGASKELAARFFINGNYTLTSQTRLISALRGVAAEGCTAYLDTAAEASDEREALFYVESAELLAGLHKASRVTAILTDSAAMLARTGTRAVALLPFDTLRWTERLENSASELAERARLELGAKSLEVRLLGEATAAARKGLAARGWRLKQGVSDGLAVPPVALR